MGAGPAGLRRGAAGRLGPGGMSWCPAAGGAFSTPPRRGPSPEGRKSVCLWTGTHVFTRQVMYVKSDPGLPVHASPQVSLTRSLLSRRSAGRNQFSSLTQSCPTLRSHGLQHARPPYPSPPPGVYSKLMSMELVMPSNHLILSHPLLLPPSIFPSIRVFSNESVLLIRWPKYWSFSFRISPSSEYSELISFGMDWLDLLAVPRDS